MRFPHDGQTGFVAARGRGAVASFSPSGEIAVAYNDTVKVDVFSGDDLYYLYSPDTSGTDGSNLMAVTWSADGLAVIRATYE